MEIAVVAALSAVAVASAAVSGWFAARSAAAYATLRRPIAQIVEDEVEDLRAAGAAQLQKAAGLLEDAQDYYERGKKARSRASGDRGGRPNAEPQTPDWTAEQYKAYLGQGGARLPALEAKLGWGGGGSA